MTCCRHAIIWYSVGLLLMDPTGIDLNEISIHIWKYRLQNGGHFVSASHLHIYDQAQTR